MPRGETGQTVMSFAKRQGAKVNAIKNFLDFTNLISKEEARASKAGMLGKLGGGIGGSIAGYLAPAALAALGFSTGGLGTMALGALAGAGVTYGGAGIGDFLARQWGMGGKGRKKEFQDIGEYKDISGPYGKQFESELKIKGKGEEKKQSQTIAELLDVEKMNRYLSSAFSGLRATGKARAGVEAWKGYNPTKEDLQDLPDNFTFGKDYLASQQDVSIGDKMAFALRGDVHEGYAAGLRDTGDKFKPTVDFLKKFGQTVMPGGDKGFFQKDAPFAPLSSAEVTPLSTDDLQKSQQALLEGQVRPSELSPRIFDMNNVTDDFSNVDFDRPIVDMLEGEAGVFGQTNTAEWEQNIMNVPTQSESDSLMSRLSSNVVNQYKQRAIESKPISSMPMRGLQAPELSAPGFSFPSTHPSQTQLPTSGKIYGNPDISWADAMYDMNALFEKLGIFPQRWETPNRYTLPEADYQYPTYEKGSK